MSASEAPSMPPPSGNNSKLDHDILWIIFSIITSHYPSPTEPTHTLHASPLTIIRRCSQVCTFWRDFILSSESIWAKCIDLDCLAQGNNDWREEVLRRTGDIAPLYVVGLRPLPSQGVILKGNNNWRSEALRKMGDVAPLYVRGRLALSFQGGILAFLINLISVYWERIQVLDVLLEQEKVLDDEKVLSAFCRPAPRLKEFSIRAAKHSIDIWRPMIFTLPYFELFAGVAPNLTRFHLHSHTHKIILPIHFRPLLLTLLTPRLRSLSIFQPLSLSIMDLLIACSHIPNLELLNISPLKLEANTLTPSLHQVTLPRLHEIHIVCDQLEIYPEFLGQIVTHADCRVSVATRLHRSERQSTDAGMMCFLDMLRIFQQHWHAFFDSKKHENGSIIAVELSILEMVLNVNVKVEIHHDNDRRYPRLYLSAPSGQKFAAEIHNLVLDAIATLRFPTSLVHAKITLVLEHPPLHRDTLGRLCGALGSIKKLSTTPLFLLALSQLTAFDDSLLFPFLKKISLYTEEAHRLDGATYIKPFFVNRHSKAPIDILYIFDERCRASLGNLEFLDEFAGMKVICQTFEYVCGSGRPEKLDYSRSI
ncbi:hypothetical protein BDN70DRAFT_883104 [Pholiota conissans]|uniref:F-box domain-containing protein n=1 Tax=Pholiota conissans TaxID=109636 RepID=A0A9P6CQJ3_9AGAR|nr:hypothetical protein BDN70DRAFT_883104 [Pholiota conissans]